MLTIFYDGQCPLCQMEMTHLKRFDNNHQIDLQDLNQADFDKKFPAIDRQKAMQILHGQLDGKLILGLEVTYHAWTLVGQRWRVAFLNWPIIKPLCKMGYRFFAKHRQRISDFASRRLGLVPTAQNCTSCSLPRDESQQSRKNHDS